MATHGWIGCSGFGAAAILAVTLAAPGCGGRAAPDPHRTEAEMYARAVAAAQAGDHATAVQAFDDLVAAAPRPEYHLARGLEHLRAGDGQRAAADATAGLALDPDPAARKDLEWLAAEAKAGSGGRGRHDALPPGWIK